MKEPMHSPLDNKIYEAGKDAWNTSLKDQGNTFLKPIGEHISDISGQEEIFVNKDKTLEERLLIENLRQYEEGGLFDPDLIEETRYKLGHLEFLVAAYKQTATFSEIKKKHHMQLACENDNLRMDLSKATELMKNLVIIFQTWKINGSAIAEAGAWINEHKTV